LAESLLDALPELVRLGAQFGVAELLHLRLERIDGRDIGHRGLNETLVLGPKNLTDECIDQTLKSFAGRELPKIIPFSLA
jgi:hypothetical protein